MVAMVVRGRRGGLRASKLPREALGAWEALDSPWRHAFQLAWEAYRYGTIPIGAVIVDGEGNLVVTDPGTVAAMGLAEVETEITTLAAHLAAAECRWLERFGCRDGSLSNTSAVR